MNDGLQKGKEARDEGIERVESNNPRFVDYMRDIAMEISIEQGQVSTDDLREHASELGIQPVHQNAWGAVFKSRGWVQVGRKASRWPSNHAREIRVWRYDVAG